MVMAKVLKIEPDSKDGLIKNLSEALEHARKGEIKHLSIIYERKREDEKIRNFYFGEYASVNLLLDIAKQDILKEFPSLYQQTYGEEET